MVTTSKPFKAVSQESLLAFVEDRDSVYCFLLYSKIHYEGGVGR